MTTKEMSDSLDSLLNSYSSEASFGKGAAVEDIVLDEYEKSVLLTLAQDIILKTYFSPNTNSEGAGFDDSAKRQVDFSSLITTATLTKATDQSSVFDERGIIYNMPVRVNGKLNPNPFDYTYDNTFHNTTIKKVSTDVLFILNERLITESNGIMHSYVIVPINYKEYDRKMSKPYTQPLKKQAWRLLQNTSQGFDMKTELIPRWNLASTETIRYYKIRYVRRPTPIILVNLPNGLAIDGYTREQECTLNPILHPEIVQRAVEIAVATRGVRNAPQQGQQRQ